MADQVCVPEQPPVGPGSTGHEFVGHQAEVAPTRPSDLGRVAGLDGIRGLAALYVVVHHCWLLTFRGYPADTGPVGSHAIRCSVVAANRTADSASPAAKAEIANLLRTSD